MTNFRTGTNELKGTQNQMNIHFTSVAIMDVVVGNTISLLYYELFVNFIPDWIPDFIIYELFIIDNKNIKLKEYSDVDGNFCKT